MMDDALQAGLTTPSNRGPQHRLTVMQSARDPPGDGSSYCLKFAPVKRIRPNRITASARIPLIGIEIWKSCSSIIYPHPPHIKNNLEILPNTYIKI